jgi:hypothetical protein
MLFSLHSNPVIHLSRVIKEFGFFGGSNGRPKLVKGVKRKILHKTHGPNATLVLLLGINKCVLEVAAKSHNSNTEKGLSRQS